MQRIKSDTLSIFYVLSRIISKSFIENENNSLSTRILSVPLNSVKSVSSTFTSKFDSVSAEELTPIQTEIQKQNILKSTRIPTSRFSRFSSLTSIAMNISKSLVFKNKLDAKTMDKIVNTMLEMRGAVLKVGQMLSIQDSKISKDFDEILIRVQNGANYMPEEQVIECLEMAFGKEWEAKVGNGSFQFKPIAAASIGQVHVSMINNEKVAIKIQYPNISNTIITDLQLLHAFVPFAPKGLHLGNLIRVAQQDLERECLYTEEAKWMTVFKSLIDQDEVMKKWFNVPEVYLSSTTDTVLTMKYVNGIPLHIACTFQSQSKVDEIGERMLELLLKEIFEWRVVQTDPNWGNFMYENETDMIHLLDFGASREIPAEFADMYLLLLYHASNRQKQECLDLSIKLGFLSGLESNDMKNSHLSALFSLAGPFMISGKYDFALASSVTTAVKKEVVVMLKERLKAPPDLVYSLHRKIGGLFLLCGRIGARVGCKKVLMRHYEKRFGMRNGQNLNQRKT